MQAWKVALNICVVAQLAALGCGSDDEGPGGSKPVVQQEAGVSAPDTGTPAAAAPEAGGGPAVVDAGGGSAGGTVDAGSTPGAGSDAGMTGGGMTGGGMTGGAPPAVGPKDGDPSKPEVTIDGVACRNASSGGGALGGLAGGIGSPNAMVGGRDLIVDYPCGKREGAHMTVILNLHGTLISNAPWQYQRGYFAAYRLASSHNLIVVQPHSASMRSGGAQWGVMDNGADLPHLLEVIDWVYKTFAKFQIRGLWVAGHSQGSIYVKTFACNEMIKDRVRGVIGMSGGAFGVGQSFGGGGGNAACAMRVSQIHTVGDAEAGATGGVPDQTAAATAHGCAAKIGPMDIGNMQMVTTWPNCSPGWVHFNVTMGAHEHTTPINPEVVKYIVDQVKSTE